MLPRGEPDSKPRVCRRLFADQLGPVDDGMRDNMLNLMNEQINRDLDEACIRYNFDFRNEVPLEGGDWKWERVGVQEGTSPPVEPPESQPAPPGPPADPPAPQTPPKTEAV